MKIKSLVFLGAVFLLGLGAFLPQASAQDAKAVLFVGSSEGSDVLLIEHLKSLGLTVVVQDAKDTEPEDADAYSLVYVSESVSSGKVGKKFKASQTPVIFSEHYVADDMGFAGETVDADFGQTAQQYREVTIRQAGHPLAAGFEGTAAVYGEDGKYSFSKPGGDVKIVATVPDDPDKAVLYAYDKGAKDRNGDAVAERRVFFFLFSGQEQRLTGDGWKLFDAAVEWGLAAGKETRMAAITAKQEEATPPKAAPVSSEGAVAVWNFDAGQGSVAEDSTGKGHDGALRNMDASAWTGGVAGKGLLFDGTDDFVQVPHNPDIDFGTGSFSISFWMLQTDHANSGRYVLKGSFKAPKSGKRYEVFHHANGEVRFAVDDDKVKSRISLPDTAFVTGQWVHVVAVRDRDKGELRLYADGKLQDTAKDETGDISQSEDLFLGGSTDENSFFAGFLDEVAFYNRALSEAEIEELYTAPPQKIVPEEAEQLAEAVDRPQGTPPFPYLGTPAFPGAEGFGAGAQGGRGGTVYKVTTLDDSGPGSLRAAVEAKGPRIVLFDVSGTIRLKSELKISEDYITIAGQTAPGDGIALRDYPLVIDANHVVVRYIRSRLGDEAKVENDAVWVAGGHDIILDHCSASWSVDETLSVAQQYAPGQTLLDNVTVQWCLIAESLRKSVHAKGMHGYGSLVRGHDGSKYSFHHNLWAHHVARMPRPGNYDSHEKDPVGAFMDFRNNVFYDWGGTSSGYNADTNSISHYNFINNYYLRGPNSKGAEAFNESDTFARAYFEGNFMDDEEPEDPWSLVSGAVNDAYKQKQAFRSGLIGLETAPAAYNRVLKGVGASLARDAVDSRIVEQVDNRTGALIDDEQDVGGWPELISDATRADTDGDGMPDTWEVSNDLAIDDPADARGDQDGDGYTNIEEYINSLVTDDGIVSDPLVDAETLVKDSFDDIVGIDDLPESYSRDEDGGKVEIVDAEDSGEMVGSAVRLHDTGKKADVEFKLSFPKQDSGLVVIDFRFMMPEPANSHKVMRVYGEKEAIQIETEGGHLSYRHGGKDYTPLLDSYEPNRWYAIRIAADPVLQKADVYVDGIRKIAGTPFRGEVTYLDRLVTHTSNGGTTDHLIDDIRISSVVY